LMWGMEVLGGGGGAGRLVASWGGLQAWVVGGGQRAGRRRGCL
jgi:hypothetical protein